MFLWENFSLYLYTMCTYIQFSENVTQFGGFDTNVITTFLTRFSEYWQIVQSSKCGRNALVSQVAKLSLRERKKYCSKKKVCFLRKRKSYSNFPFLKFHEIDEFSFFQEDGLSVHTIPSRTDILEIHLFRGFESVF